MIYLDAAATTLEKPPQVRQAMAQAAAELSTPGRGSPPPAGRRRRPSGVGPRRRRYSACRRRRTWCSP